jgi:hypothetical protein
MNRNRRLTGAACFIGGCLTLILMTACQSGPTAVGDSPPLIQPVDAMVFSYELGKPKPPQEDTKPLGNTKWQVMSITPKPDKAFATRILQFQPDGNLLETTTYADGSAKSETSRYHIVGSTMIVNKPENDLNIRFKVEGNSLIMDTGDYSILLLRIN